jgi:hypothetical protein
VVEKGVVALPVTSLESSTHPFGSTLASWVMAAPMPPTGRAMSPSPNICIAYERMSI